MTYDAWPLRKDVALGVAQQVPFFGQPMKESTKNPRDSQKIVEKTRIKIQEYFTNTYN